MRSIFVNPATMAIKKNIVFSVVMAALLFCTTPAMPASGSMQLNRVIAVVNGELITMYDLQQRAMQEIMSQGFTGNDSYAAEQRERIYNDTMDSMILDILYKQEAERYNVAIEDSEVENELRKIMQSNNLEQQEFERQLKLQGMTVDFLRGRIRDGLMRQRIVGLMVGRKAEVTPADVEKYYNDNQSLFSMPSNVEFSVIMLGPGSDAAKVYGEINDGELSFADAAKKYSVSPTAATGGRMGNIAWRDLNPAWREALENLQPGETSQPIEAGGATIFLHVDALHEGSVQAFEEVRDKIEEDLRTNRLQERFEEFNGQLRARAVVDIKL